MRHPAYPVTSRIALALTVAALALGACRETTVVSPEQGISMHAHGPEVHQSGPITGEVQRQIAQLRDVTAAFHRFEAAEAAGYGTRITGCFSSPAGGMGYHYGDPALIDGVVELLKPELLLYEPQKNGKLRLVAVEYIVPFDAWTGADPPELMGQSFHRNEGFGLWVLHVWHFAHNPAGMFADWNPTISCRYARD